MRNPDEVKIELSALSTRGNVFAGRKEVRELHEILNSDEHVLALTSGNYDGRSWVMAATSERILFLDKVMFVGMKKLEIVLTDLKEAAYERDGIGSCLFFVRNDGARCIVKSVNKATAPEFAVAVNEHLEKLRNPPKPAPVLPPIAVVAAESRQFEYTCPHCQARLGVDNAWINLDLECPECRQGIRPRPTLRTIAPPPGQEAPADAPEGGGELRPESGYKHSTSIFSWWIWLLLALLLAFMIVGTSRWVGGNFSCSAGKVEKTR
jgi:DNA-directed RNA polymerase subunit RPC12/RpoP